ncbi:MAG: class I SAM-dependent methyltransferase [Euryarchaeota archaeon]|nr:class I SAM-dependent methyltransferase [Euryarchaeota archaeon]
MKETEIGREFELYWKRRFSERALEFESDVDIGWWSEHSFKQRFVTFFNNFEEISTDKRLRILDIGCGSGVYDRTLNTWGHEVIGADYSECVVHKAVEKSNGGCVQYLVSAVPHLPFKDGSFDSVVCVGVLQYIKNEDIALKDITRVLREGEGILMLITLNSLSLRIIYKKMLNFFLRKEKINERRYNPYRLKHMLRDFDNLKITGIYIFPKKLISLEKASVNILNRLHPISLVVAHAFLIKGNKK